MFGANTKSAAAGKRNISMKCNTPATYCPGVCKLTKVASCQYKHSNHHLHRCRDHGIDWCGFRSLVSSVTARLTAGIANRRGIPTSSSDISAQVRSKSSSSKAISLRKDNVQNIPSKSEVEAADSCVQCPLSKDTGSGTYGGSVSCAAEDDDKKNIEDDGCSGCWWWDTAWYDLTSVTPADASTFWKELDSWLSCTTLLDDDKSARTHQTKPNVIDSVNGSSCITAAPHRDVTSASCTRDDDETTNSAGDDYTGVVEDMECSGRMKDYGDSALKTALLRAASRGHRDDVCAMLQRASRARKVAPVDTDLYDVVNCVDSQVGLYGSSQIL